MRKSQSSLTATGIAVMRAVESERPADERICYDPFAKRFVSSWFYHVMRSLHQKWLHRVAAGPGERIPGWRVTAISMMYCRAS